MAWAATTSFETTDGSTSPTDGNNIAGTGDGTGWTGNWTEFNATTGYHDYDTDITGIPDGSWSCMCNTGTGNLEPGVYRQLSSGVTSGRLTLQFRCNKENRDTHFVMFYASGNTGTRYFYIDFDRVVDGNGRDLEDSTGVIASGVVFKNTWYKIDIDFDCTTDTFDVYIDDVKKNGSARNFENVATTIDYIALKNGASSAAGSTAGSIHWFDQIANGDAVASTFIPRVIMF